MSTLCALWWLQEPIGGIISSYDNVLHTWLYPANWVWTSSEVQIMEILLAEWTSTYYDQSLMTLGWAGSHRDDHVHELSSEDPPRIYNHLILMEKTKSTRLRHCPPIQIVCIQIDEILVWRLESHVSGKEGLLAWTWRVEIIEIPPQTLFSTKWYMSTSVISCRSTHDILRAASQARPGLV